MATPEQWKQFHYPKPLKVKPKNPIAYKLIDSVNKTTIVQGNYALCMFKKKQINNPNTKIERV